MLPFLKHNDGTRLLMASNMQRQALPLLKPILPFILTPLDRLIPYLSGHLITSVSSGRIMYADGSRIIIKDKKNNFLTYNLEKYQRSNQGTPINKKPLVLPNEKVVVGQVLAESSSTRAGQVALGSNVLIAYSSWSGYNFEDGIIVSDRLIYDNVFTSIYIIVNEVSTQNTKFGSEKFSRDLPFMELDSPALQKLDKNGLIKLGSWVSGTDIIAGRLTPRAGKSYAPEQRIMLAVLGLDPLSYRNSSIHLSFEDAGRVVDIKFRNSYYLEQDEEECVKIYIAQRHYLQLGDKLSGRHGNKGIVSHIVKRRDMPCLLDGSTIDMLLTPLGVPSRLNPGQLYESLLGLGAMLSNIRIVFPYQLTKWEEDLTYISYSGLITRSLEETESLTLLVSGALYHPISDKTGGNVSLGLAHFLKLEHEVEKKFHARSTGPYSIITQQPVAGRSQGGGQRVGEMEVWALEAWGATYNLHELLTLKSDDMIGREDTLEAIVHGKHLPLPTIPETVKVLVRELQAACLDLQAFKRTSHPITGEHIAAPVSIVSDYPFLN
jgi:DNA-directed RNA polymerase subunit beta